MAISEEAQREHDAPFPNYQSALKMTDPEFLELFDNWAFGEVPTYGVLDAKMRLMVQREPRSGSDGYRAMNERKSIKVWVRP
jgi:hypothetical protein